MDPERGAQRAEQGMLFGDSLLSDGVSDQSGGYRGPVVNKIVEITYRQLDYWARTGLVESPRCGRRGDQAASGCTP
jgi:hypothetical protein